MTLRVLWASDAAWSTSGYAVETALAATRLKDHCELALLATFGLHGGMQTWEGIPVFPGGADAFSNDVIAKAARAWRADVVITLKDSIVFNPQSFAGFRWLPMVPVDHDPSSPQVIERARASYRPIAYAPHGFRTLRAAGLDPLYAPHGFDPSVYYPMDKAEARKVFGLSDDLFIVGTCAVNRGGLPSRKAWVENLQAFARFAADKPNARYFVHTDLADDGYEAGLPLRQIIAQHGMLDRVLFCDQERYRYGGFPTEYMRAYYNSLDVLNAVSLGEGFGIPALEAQACGTPVILGDWCAHEDLCFAGWKVEKGEAHHFYDQQQGYVYMPEVAAIADRLQEAYTSLGLPKAGRYWHDKAIAGAAPYAIDRVITSYWLPLLAEVERDIRSTSSRGVLRIVRKEEVFA
jgi:glycosyltransferase involved in cell wall biosynthesis